MRYRNSRCRSLRPALCGIFVAALVVLSGCATPVGVRHLNPQEAQRQLTASVLSGDTLSAPTMQILNRSGMARQFQTQPGEVIADLHKGMPTAREADRLFALAELSFLHASKGGDRSYFLSAATYAYAFLFPRDASASPDPFDPRLRIAVDLYNQGIAEGFTAPETRQVVLRGGSYRLPFGELTMTIDQDEFRWGSFRLVSFVDATELDVRGLRNRYRWPGIGAPLVAALEPLPGVEAPQFTRVPSGIRVAVTAFLRLDNLEEGLDTGRLTGRLELYTTQKNTSIAVEGRTVPLEFGLTAALADTLEGSQVYEFELKGLFSGDFALLKDTARFKDNVLLMEPYRPGRIPVVLVHGTASSPARWAEMLNELENDRELWGRYQVWLFTYNTGNPILYSGGILTEGLRRVVHELDPEGKDSALRKMVVIGHSQGGLLTKLTAIDSGSRFWENAFAVPIDQLDLSPETKDLLRRSLYYQPLPFVKRVVFIATPHRGSFVSGGWIGRMAGKLISVPSRILSPIEEIFDQAPEALATRSLEQEIPKSTDNMDPQSPFIRTFSSIPIAPGVTVHSIIAVKNPNDPKEEWNDGVVAYSSAHIDGVASELTVKSSHSTQDTPQTIEEVRRILVENLQGP